MSDTQTVLAAGTDLDPDIRRFAAAIARAYAEHPPLDHLSVVEARAVCEAVRAPWAQGGPQTAVHERRIETPVGEVAVRVYDPAPERAPKPALVYLHGGGWVFFSLDSHDRLMREYAARSGMVVVGVDYARSPEAKFPIALEQTVAVTRWLRKHGEDVGVRREKIALGGDSAGGNLALSAALSLRDQGEDGLVSALLLNYGAFSAACSDEACRRYGGAAYNLTCEELLVYFDAYLNGAEDRRDPLAQPVLAQLHGLPPTFFTLPECDVLTEQNLMLADRLRAAGGEVRTELYPGAVHSFLEAAAISALAGRALQDGADWLRQIMERQP